jgi:dimethylamine/trimethylamine dehydrogenase
MISEAIFDGHRLAREIDAPDPARPLPFDRERGIPDVGPVVVR